MKQAHGREKFPKPRNVIGFAKDLPVPEMEKPMLTHASVTDASSPSTAPAPWPTIAKTGKVGAERVFVLEPKLKAEAGEKAKASGVDFSPMWQTGGNSRLNCSG